MSAASPAPWTRHTNLAGHTYVRGADGRIVATGIAGDGGGEFPSEGYAARLEANAALVVAAPDLYAEVLRLRLAQVTLVSACECVLPLIEEQLEEFRSDDPDDFPPVELFVAWQAVHSALKEATGKDYRAEAAQPVDPSTFDGLYEDEWPL